VTSDMQEYLIVEIGKKNFALNTCFIESIHSSSSINFNEDLSRCLPYPEMDWDKSFPVFTFNELSNNKNKTSSLKHSSRVIFLSDNQTGRNIAVIVDAIRKILEVSVSKGNQIEATKFDGNHQFLLDNDKVTIFDIRNVFMT
jgi:chemotaxis signal transduction protein